MQCTPINNVGYDTVFNGNQNNVVYYYDYVHFFIILLELLLRFNITDHCVGMHSLQVNNYLNVLLLYLVYKSVINM